MIVFIAGGILIAAIILVYFQFFNNEKENAVVETKKDTAK